MAWIAAADGFHLRLAPTIATALSDALPELTDSLLGDVPRRDVHWLVHPGGPRILEKVAQTLGLPDEAVADSRTALASAGNRSSATVLAMLADSARGNWNGPAALFGFGPGLTAECLLLERS